MAFDIDLTFSSDLSQLTENFQKLLKVSTEASEAVKKTNVAIQTESRKSAIEVGKVEESFKNTAKVIGSINTQGIDAFTSGLTRQAETIDQVTQETEQLQQAADKLVDSLLKEGVAGAKAADQLIAAINKESNALAGLIEERLLASDPKAQQKLNLEIAKQITVIKQLKTEFEKMNDIPPPENQTEGFKRLQVQIREAEKEAQRLGEIYGITDERFLEAANAAAVLKEQLNDVKDAIAAQNPEQKFKAFETAVGGVIGSFQALTGAIQLFGGESEEVQKIAQKLQGLFNFSQGINTLFTLKDSFSNLLGVLGLTTRATVTNTVATVAQGTAATGTAAAITGEAVATNVATTATNRFTAALLANPFTAIAVALAAIVVAIVAYSESADDAAESQAKINEGLEREIETLRQYSAELSKASQARIDATKNELDLAKALDAPLNERIRLEQELAKQRLEGAVQLAAFRGEEVANIGLLQAKLQSLQVEYDSLKAAGTDEEILKVKEAELKILQGQVTEIENIIKGVKEARKEYVLTNAETTKLDLSNQLEQARALIRTRIAEAKEGSAQELKANLDALALEEKAKIEALNNDSSREAERLAIIAETNRKRLELENEYLITRLKNQQTADEVLLLQAQKNSEKELEAKVKILEDERKIALAELNITENEKLKIRLQTEQKIGELRKAFALSQVEEAINREKTDAALRLALSEEFSAQELQAKKDIITAEEELNIQKINAELIAEEDKAQKIDVIQAKARNEREKLDADSFNRTLQLEAQFAKQSSDIKINLLQREIQAETTGGLTRIALQNEIYNEQLAQYDREFNDLNDLLAKKLISEEEYLLKVQKLRAEAEQTTFEKTQNEAKRFADIYTTLGLDITESTRQQLDAIGQNLQASFNSFVAIRQEEIDIAKQQNQELLASIEESIQATSESINQEIELAKLGYANNVDAKRAELEELNKLKIKGLENSKKIAKEEQRLAQLQAIVDASRQAGAITVAAANLFAQESTKGIAGVVAAIGAISLILSTFLAFKASAAAAAKPVQFGGGGTLDSGTLKGHSHSHPSKGMRIEGTNILVEGDEEIIRKKSAKKYRKVLKAINDDDFSELTYGDIKMLLMGTGVELRPDIATEIVNDRKVLQTINQNAIIKAETEPLRKEMVAMKEEIKGLRKDNQKKESTTFYPDGSRVEKKGNTTNIVRPV
jgi:hypothetical protein